MSDTMDEEDEQTAKAAVATCAVDDVDTNSDLV
jgi:hypothetical protein